jgi:hypothetical protein
VSWYHQGNSTDHPDQFVVWWRGKKVADDIDPKQTTIETVESIITGMPMTNSVVN